MFTSLPVTSTGPAGCFNLPCPAVSPAMHHQAVLSELDNTRSTPIVESKASKLDSKKRNRTEPLGATRSLQLEEDIDVEIVEATLDEFAFVQFIPETPPPSDSEASRPVASNNTREKEDRLSEWQLPLRAGRGAKRKRIESIRSNQEADYAINQTLTGNTDTGDERVRHISSPRTATQTPRSIIETKLKALPPGAPRVIETKGRYTIRKGVRIRDYKLPNPAPWPCTPPSSSPEYQCRDGFNRSEASLGYPQPMVIQSRRTEREETQSKYGREQASRSPSLGTTDQR